MKIQSRWAIFISGRGSNLAAAIDELGDEIKLVVTSNVKAGGILRAKRAGIKVLELPRLVDWWLLSKVLKEHQINKIFLLGFMKIIPIEFIQSFGLQILNLHPSLLPLYPGLESIKRAYDEKANVGVSVHQVIPEVDAGEILMQKTSCVSERLSNFSYDEVELKVHQDEQLLVRQAIAGY